MEASARVVRASPYGETVDPHDLKGSAYTSAEIVLNQAIYSLADTIFSYESPGAVNALDAHLDLWATAFRRTNAIGAVPLFHRLEPRAGAGLALLGFAEGRTNGPLTVVAAANVLSHMQPTLAGVKVPLSLNVSALDWDADAAALVSNYAGPVAVARGLGVPVISPVSDDASELQSTVVLNHFLAALTKKPSVHLSDGPNAICTFKKIHGILSPTEVGRVYQQLLTLQETIPATVDAAVEFAFAAFNKALDTNIGPFEYTGAANPDTVFVVHGTQEAAQVAALVERSNSNIGVIKVRVPFPFLQKQFVAAVPHSASKVVVLSQNLALKGDVTAALYLAGRYSKLEVLNFVYPLTFVWSPIAVYKILAEFTSIDELVLDSALSTPPPAITANTSPEGAYTIWARDNSDLARNADRIALALSLDNSKDVSLRSMYDTSQAGGIFLAHIVSQKKLGKALSIADAADVVLIEDASILESHDVLATAKVGATVLLVNNKTISNLDDYANNLPQTFRQALAQSHLKLVIIDLSIVEDLDALNDSTKGFSANFLAQIGFWRASLPEIGHFVVNKLIQGNGNDFELLAAVLDKFVATVDEKKGLQEVNVLPAWAELEKAEAEKSPKDAEEKEDEDLQEPLPFFVKETSFFPNARTEPVAEDETYLGPAVNVSKKLVFAEAYGAERDLRPDLPVKNFVVKVQENKRLTPAEYSRNIFHIEFDITGTGLTYDIGEALGIHGKNNEKAVEDFLEFYGVEGETLIEKTHKEDPTLLESRSARQILTENVDFLGKPPKRFYESLTPYAEDKAEREALEKLASPAGAEDLKKRQDVDFCSYWDILEEFPSARPPFEVLVCLISPLKRREYSIASSQKMHPNAVHLLIVVVDWVDPRGRSRFGHCSKYLSDLSIGDELVVSVKPSVMKLPKLTEEPIVMSGLGTGLAPFKAFIEEKIWQQAQGHQIGEIYLFMGSRHKKEEYLYGELWEAYMDAGVLTHIGAAFSRDQPEKIYIQDKIRSTIEELTDAIVTKHGSFYLCGPTWPVPDITACLEDIVQNGAKREGKTIEDVAKVVEDMKEDGRYILEVY